MPITKNGDAGEQTQQVKLRLLSPGERARHTTFSIIEQEKHEGSKQVIQNRTSAGQQEWLFIRPDIRAYFQTESPIEIAMETGDKDMFENALKDAKRDGYLEKFNSRGDTALGTAILKSDLPAIQALLDAKASVERVSDKNESALHKAVHDPIILKYLLDKTNAPSTFDNKGLDPIHVAVSARNPESVKLLLEKFNNATLKTVHEEHTPLDYVMLQPSIEVAEVILDSHPEALFVVNKQGDTPLHTAVKNNNRCLAALLLKKGAVLSTKNKNGVTVLELIANIFYDASNFFNEVFDEFISRKPLKDNDVNYEVDVNYQVLTDGGNKMSQLKVLEEFVDCGQSNVLIHPLMESLLYLKWIHFLPLFYAMILVYAIFLASVNIFAISIFYYEDLMSSASTMTAMNISSVVDAAPTAASGDEPPGSELNAGVYWLLIALIYTSMLILFVQECFFISQNHRRYFTSWESWVKLSGLVLCAVTPPLVAYAPGPWARHAACAAILLVWIQAMFLISRLPRYGFYIFMFGKVAMEILKILVTAIFLVIAYSICFMIQFRSAPPFDGPFATFVKTLVMMSSEFDYEGLFGEAHVEQLRGTSTFVRFLFLTFVIFVAIVLMNFMIGLAVSDINELNQTGNIRRLEKQVELLSTLDSLIYDGVLSTPASKCFRKTFTNKRYPLGMSTETRNQSIWDVQYGTRMKHEGKLASENKMKPTSVKIRSTALYKAIVEAASKNDQRSKKHNDVGNNISKYTIDALYDAIMNRPIATDTNEGNQEKERSSTKQNEQIKSLINQLAMALLENNEMKRSFENLYIKMDNLLSQVELKR